MAAQVAHERPLVSVNGKHTQPVTSCVVHAAGTGPFHYLWMALMCICRPFRLDARCPHSSHTNGFSPRCFAASCTRSSVRVRKVLGHWGHYRVKHFSKARGGFLTEGMC